MSNDRNFLLVFLIVIIVNSAGFLLKYFQFDTYFILIGFRFHISLLISLLCVLNYIDFVFIKEMFVHPLKQRFVLILTLAFLPLLFIPFDFFILKQFNIADQDYFFELGLSSIIDYPVYLLWNAPQLFMFFIFMNTVLKLTKFKFIKASLLTLFLFIYELIPFEKAEVNFSSINYFTIASFFFIAVLSGLFISRVKNIYLFAIILFSVLWGIVLSFGSNSETLVNILLASQYENWAGFIKFGKKFEYTEYLQPAYLFLITIFSFIVLKKSETGSAS